MITVLTTTYNRGILLKRLYESLLKQSSSHFEWLIVDDGSSDDTKEIVKDFKKENKLNIKYFYKKNGGKHRALNLGISKANGILIFIVDSDDWLEKNAIEEIENAYKVYKDNNSICGFSFLRKFPNGEINGKFFGKNYEIASYIDMRINNNDMMADKAEVYYKKCLQEFPFPEYDGEKFLSEDIVWVKLARKYKMVHINKAIYIGDYLTGGLTKKRRINNIKSPIGCMNRANLYLTDDVGVNLKFKSKCAIQYLIYGWFAKKNTNYLLSKSNNKRITILMIIPSRIIYVIWKIKIKGE